MLTISQLAAYAGVTVRAVRHYHQVGLLPEPERDASGYRRYDAAAVIELIRIRTLAEAGVPLARVHDLLEADAEEFETAVAEIDRRLRAEVRQIQEHRRRIALLAAGDSLALPDEVVELPRPAPRERRPARAWSRASGTAGSWSRPAGRSRSRELMARQARPARGSEDAAALPTDRRAGRGRRRRVPPAPGGRPAGRDARGVRGARRARAAVRGDERRRLHRAAGLVRLRLPPDDGAPPGADGRARLDRLDPDRAPSAVSHPASEAPPRSVPRPAPRGTAPRLARPGGSRPPPAR